MLSATSSLHYCLKFFEANCPLICLNRISILTCRKRRFQVGVQSLSKTSSLAPGVRQLRPVIYYYEFRRRRSHAPSVFCPKVARFYFATRQPGSSRHTFCLAFSKPNCSLIRFTTHTPHSASFSSSLIAHSHLRHRSLLPSTASSVASRSAYKASVRRRH